MTKVSRRSFLAGSVLAADATAMDGRQALTDPPTAQRIRSGIELVTLGRTGIRTTLLGLGTNEHVLRCTEDFRRVVRHALDRGLRFIDTADTYGSHTSDPRGAERYRPQPPVYPDEDAVPGPRAGRGQHRALPPGTGRRDRGLPADPSGEGRRVAGRICGR